MQEHDARTDADRWHPATERPSELPGADRATSSSLFTSLSLSLPVTVQAAPLRIWPNQSFSQQRRRRKVGPGTVRLWVTTRHKTPSRAWHFRSNLRGGHVRRNEVRLKNSFAHLCACLSERLLHDCIRHFCMLLDVSHPDHATMSDDI